MLSDFSYSSVLTVVWTGVLLPLWMWSHLPCLWCPPPLPQAQIPCLLHCLCP